MLKDDGSAVNAGQQILEAGIGGHFAALHACRSLNHSLAVWTDICGLVGFHNPGCALLYCDKCRHSFDFTWRPMAHVWFKFCAAILDGKQALLLVDEAGDGKDPANAGWFLGAIRLKNELFIRGRKRQGVAVFEVGLCFIERGGKLWCPRELVSGVLVGRGEVEWVHEGREVGQVLKKGLVQAPPGVDLADSFQLGYCGDSQR